MQMHGDTLNRFCHTHDSSGDSSENEKRTLLVIVLTGLTMVVEVIAGYVTGSMALLADGWHMGTHVLALGITYAGYLLARRYRGSGIFSFGTGKFNILGGYTSALFLGLAGAWMIVESVERLIEPQEIAFSQAIVVVIIGLAVNLLSVIIMGGHGHSHTHDHEHEHDHEHGEHEHGHDCGDSHGHGKKSEAHDHSFRAAYLHVIADAFTSVLALIALLCGQYMGWAFLDPVIGIVGGAVICKWAFSLLRTTGLLLLDGGVDRALLEEIGRRLESDGDSRLADLHVWNTGPGRLAVIASVVTGQGRQPEEYQRRVREVPGVEHVSIEVNSCQDENCACATQ